MVLRRILSFLAIAGVALIMSCYDVQLDTNESVDQDWAEGLTTAQIVTWMGVNVEPVASKADEDVVNEVEISWECPLVTDTWELWYSADGATYEDLQASTVDEGTDSKCTTPVTIYRSPSYFDGRQYYKYKCKTDPVNNGNCVHYFQLKMKDDGGNYHQCYTQIPITPKKSSSYTIRITVTGAEADAPSSLEANFTDGVIFQKVSTGLEPVEYTIDPNQAVNFFLITDLTQQGGNSNSHHNSSSSFCNVTIKTPSVIEGRNVVSTLEYNFEDLSHYMIKYEPTREFDYNDAVFTVDIIEN